jgi:23S rRNA (uracil1939-C5)-methyltransferase
MPETKPLHITDLTWEGIGVAHNEEGIVVMVAGGLIGDIVHIKPDFKQHKNYIKAEVSELVSPSPHRIPHPCIHHIQGCPASPLGALDYHFALDWKFNHLRETLKRLGRYTEIKISPPVPSPSIWNYRDRLELHLANVGGRTAIGYVSRSGFVAIDECHLGTLPIRKSLNSLSQRLKAYPLAKISDKAIRVLIRDNGRNKSFIIVFIESNLAVADFFVEVFNSLELAGWQIRTVTDMDNRFFKSKLIKESGDTKIYIKVDAKREIALPPLVFTQANRQASAILRERILHMCPEGGNLCELYGGFGAFAIDFVIKKRGKATIIDSSPSAIVVGKRFAERFGLPLQYKLWDLKHAPASVLKIDKFDIAILDPPRKGVHRSTLSSINHSHIPIVIYLSCNPGTLARDLSWLESYRVIEFTPFDLFPNTPDLETIAVLRI